MMLMIDETIRTKIRGNKRTNAEARVNFSVKEILKSIFNT